MDYVVIVILLYFSYASQYCLISVESIGVGINVKIEEKVIELSFLLPLTFFAHGIQASA